MTDATSRYKELPGIAEVSYDISIRHPICTYANGGDDASVRNPIEIELAVDNRALRIENQPDPVG